MPPLPPKVMWVSISISRAFIWSTILVTIVGKGELVPQACHSCNVTDPLASSLGGEREVEAEAELYLLFYFILSVDCVSVSEFDHGFIYVFACLDAKKMK